MNPLFTKALLTLLLLALPGFATGSGTVVDPYAFNPGENGAGGTLQANEADYWVLNASNDAELLVWIDQGQVSVEVSQASVLGVVNPNITERFNMTKGLIRFKVSAVAAAVYVFKFHLATKTSGGETNLSVDQTNDTEYNVSQKEPFLNCPTIGERVCLNDIGYRCQIVNELNDTNWVQEQCGLFLCATGDFCINGKKYTCTAGVGLEYRKICTTITRVLNATGSAYVLNVTVGNSTNFGRNQSCLENCSLLKSGIYSVKVFTDVEAAGVFIDGRKTCTTKKSGDLWCYIAACSSECIAVNLSEGRHVVTARKNGFEDKSVFFEVPKENQVHLELTEIMYRIIVVPLNYPPNDDTLFQGQADIAVRNLKTLLPNNICGQKIVYDVVKTSDCQSKCDFAGSKETGCQKIALECYEKSKFSDNWDKIIGIWDSRANNTTAGALPCWEDSDKLCAGVSGGIPFEVSVTGSLWPQTVAHEYGHSAGLCHECGLDRPAESTYTCPNEDVRDNGDYVMCYGKQTLFSPNSTSFLLNEVFKDLVGAC